MKLERGHQTIQLESHWGRTGERPQRLEHFGRPLPSRRSYRKPDPFLEQQRREAAFGSLHLPDMTVPQLHQMSQLAVRLRGDVNTLQLSSSQAF